MSTIVLSPQQNTERKATTFVSVIDAASTSETQGRLRAPLFVPRQQTYYWTREWQEAEARAVREIAAGQLRRFASGAEAAAWLLSDDSE
jgi:hypothetical protein